MLKYTFRPHADRLSTISAIHQWSLMDRLLPECQIIVGIVKKYRLHDLALQEAEVLKYILNH